MIHDPWVLAYSNFFSLPSLRILLIAYCLYSNIHVVRLDGKDRKIEYNPAEAVIIVYCLRLYIGCVVLILNVCTLCTHPMCVFRTYEEKGERRKEKGSIIYHSHSHSEEG